MVYAERMDDATLGAFEYQLRDIEAEIDREDLADLPFANGSIVPLDIQNKPWARSIVYRRVTRVGSFKLLRSYATDLPMVNVLTEEFTQIPHKWGGAYWYSDDDIEAAVKQEINIEQEDIAAVVEVGEQTLNDLIAYGDRKLKMPGFLNHPDILYSFSPVALDSSSTTNQCLAVLNDAVNSVVSLTLQIEKPDTMLMDIDTYQYLITARLDSVQNSTILKFFLETNPYIKNIQPINELKGAGAAGGNLLMVYKRDPKKCKAKITQPLTWLQLNRKGLGYERPAVMKYAGLQVRRPYSMHAIELPTAA